MNFIRKKLFTLTGFLAAAIVLGVNKIGEFYVFAPEDKYYLDVIISSLLVAAGVLLDLNIQKLTQEREVEAELRRANEQLRESLAHIKTLRGLLPICASCKKIRDPKGYWQQLEDYLLEHSEAEPSHAICPDCARRLYGVTPTKDGGVETWRPP